MGSARYLDEYDYGYTHEEAPSHCFGGVTGFYFLNAA